MEIDLSQLPVPTTPPDSFSCNRCAQAFAPIDLKRYDKKYVLCAPCGKKYFDEVRAIEHEHLKGRYNSLYARGLLRENFPDAGFQKSTPEIEALNTEAWRAAKDWKGDSNIYLFGPVGCGKSFLALSILKRVFCATKGRDVAEIAARRFAKLSDRFDEGRGMLSELTKVNILLIDDLDKAIWDPERLAALWEILDDRMVGNRRTIITANVAPLQLREMLRAQSPGNQSLADAALDRLKPCLTLELKGKSLRSAERIPA